ncbi:hypothetical protein BC835DRAFT_390752 [Cytidiella melzeri]|nr:hypothetical protein BC835DRAFT_390752 [Cytidiella melzeri]
MRRIRRSILRTTFSLRSRCLACMSSVRALNPTRLASQIGLEPFMRETCCLSFPLTKASPLGLELRLVRSLECTPRSRRDLSTRSPKGMAQHWTS